MTLNHEAEGRSIIVSALAVSDANGLQPLGRKTKRHRKAPAGRRLVSFLNLSYIQQMTYHVQCFSVSSHILLKASGRAEAEWWHSLRSRELRANVTREHGSQLVKPISSRHVTSRRITYIHLLDQTLTLHPARFAWDLQYGESFGWYWIRNVSGELSLSVRSTLVIES